MTPASQVVFFTSDADIVRREQHQVYHCGSSEQEVLLINERQVMSDMGAAGLIFGSGAAQPDLLERPSTAVVGPQRGR